MILGWLLMFKSDNYLDNTADVLMCLGLLGLIYKVLTNQISSRTVDKVITTYNTGKMWKGFLF